MRKVRKPAIEKKDKPVRTVTPGDSVALISCEELRKKTSPAALKETAIFVCTLAAFGFATVFIFSMRWSTTEFLNTTILPILAAAVCVGVSVVKALLPDYFIHEKLPLSIIAYTNMIEFQRSTSVLRILRNENLRITYEPTKQKLCLYGDILQISDNNSSQKRMSYRIAKVSIYMQRQHVEEMASAIPQTVFIVGK